MKHNMQKRILLSGGWGYANLGDDAILVATVKVIKDAYPNSELIITSYNPEETRQSVNDENIEIINSLHRTLVGSLTEKRCEIVDPKDVKFVTKSIVRKKLLSIYSRFKEQVSLVKFYYYKNNLSSLPNYTIYRNIDIFIQGGGGYYNDGWPDNAYARSLELILINKLKVKSIVVGQSVGPFKFSISRKIAIESLKNVSILSVRDEDSYEELTKYGLMVNKLIPDTAMSDLQSNTLEKASITVITGGSGLTESQINIISTAVVSVSKEYDLPIKIIVSRLWQGDINSAIKLYEMIKVSQLELNRVELNIPKNFVSLQREISESKIVISQNLHGLILAWRDGIRGVSLNTTRKFVGFMRQSNQEDYIQSINNLEVDVLISTIKKALDSKINLNHFELGLDVREEIINLIKDVKEY